MIIYILNILFCVYIEKYIGTDVSLDDSQPSGDFSNEKMRVRIHAVIVNIKAQAGKSTRNPNGKVDEEGNHIKPLAEKQRTMTRKIEDKGPD